MGKINLSVVIPTYNRAQTVVRAIKSVLNQTQQAAEIIVVDDGSSDNTRELVAKSFGNLVSYHNITHSGLPAVARNYGLRMVNSEYVAFLDSDDIWMSKKLELQLGSLKPANVIGSATNAVVIRDRNTTSMYQKMPDNVTYRDLSLTNWIVCSSFVGKTLPIKKIGGFPEEYRYRSYEDWLLWMRLSTVGDITLINKKLVKYRDDKLNSVRNNQEDWDSIRNELMTDIIPWGFKNILSHPKKTRLIKDIYYAKRYLKNNK